MISQELARLSLLTREESKLGKRKAYINLLFIGKRSCAGIITEFRILVAGGNGGCISYGATGGGHQRFDSNNHRIPFG
jgi:hypothetical protein